MAKLDGLRERKRHNAKLADLLHRALLVVADTARGEDSCDEARTVLWDAQVMGVTQVYGKP